ncbi:PIN domain-containing protein [Novosphingobium sp.]|uniref:PIN domain-containing protein n=1 Tax=Novosphingobium sp. TaxID=1874826 RepID=UPI00286AA620|nr:PIN domain-containing protein [Novosphingobium sp.]
MAHFADTNIAVYALLPGARADEALAALGGATISVQVLNEFANVALRKFGLDQLRLNEKISEIRFEVDRIMPVTEETHDLARKIVFRYKLSFYDSALIASALLADCDTFYSEDLQHGLLIKSQLRVVNPFA